MRGLIAAALFAVPVMAAAAASAPPPPVTAHDAWVTLMPPGVRVAAGYLVLENRSPLARPLVAVSSPAFARVEVHETYRDSSRVLMRRITNATVPARGTLALAPGGMHLMLFDPAQPLELGTEIELVVSFSDGTHSVVRATVRDPRGPDPAPPHRH